MFWAPDGAVLLEAKLAQVCPIVRAVEAIAATSGLAVVGVAQLARRILVAPGMAAIPASGAFGNGTTIHPSAGALDGGPGILRIALALAGTRRVAHRRRNCIEARVGAWPRVGDICVEGRGGG